MLDRSNLQEFSGEEPETCGRLLVSDELLAALTAIERELSAFIRGAAEETAGIAADEAATAGATD